ncbi:aldose 1-epimerase [Streptococcus pneumoniae]|nr:aldose epimerase family protein [Streptococcus pneumoniae]VNC80667.1 aldose 1-epimerase [Streptococcus pneumoniae]VNH65115.1 aldose 1-epimerase [Streptococcus pneumoniae]VNU63227.1 aldose 1-epimerase [Streptococcus pneumoniae]
MKAYTERVFGNVEGEDVLAYRFETDGGYQLEVMTYGATILRYVAPDKAGNFANVILGFDDFDSYVGNSPKHGASVGPVAGRIAGATFELNGKTYDLEVNNASNCNHSGSTGWDSSLFEVEEVSDHGLTLYTERTDGTGGFPGNLKIWISYHLEETGAYEISYKVTTDQDTLVNPTNHSYFNLSGDFTQTIDRHVFQLNTEGIYSITPDGVPAKTPEANRDVVKHIYNGTLLKDIFAEEDEQIQLASGLDHPFALPVGHDNAGFLYDQNSGRFLLFKTEAPCFVVYTANFVDESVIIGGQPMLQHNGITLEAQALPDAIHSALKGQVILKAGQTFTSKTRYELVVK